MPDTMRKRGKTLMVNQGGLMTQESLPDDKGFFTTLTSCAVVIEGPLAAM
jgi:hypothetical protein